MCVCARERENRSRRVVVFLKCFEVWGASLSLSKRFGEKQKKRERKTHITLSLKAQRRREERERYTSCYAMADISMTRNPEVDSCFRGCCVVREDDEEDERHFSNTNDDASSIGKKKNAEGEEEETEKQKKKKKKNETMKMTFRMPKELINIYQTFETTVNENKNKESKRAIKMFSSNASEVYLSRIEGQPVAIKLPKLRTKTDIDRYHAELRIVSSLKHENVCAILGARAWPPEYALVFPWYENGSVHQAIHVNRWIPNLGGLYKVCWQTARALQYLKETHDVVHRDVKPSNILLDEKWNAKLTDFGLSEHRADLENSLQAAIYNESLKSEDAEGRAIDINGKFVANDGNAPSGGFQKQHLVGTLAYIAPEVLMRVVSTYASDVYSSGITFNEIATRVEPYADRERNVALAHTCMDLSYNDGDLAKAIVIEDLRPVKAFDPDDEANRRTTTTTTTTDDSVEVSLQREFEKLVSEMWDGKPENRPDFAEIEKRLREGVVAYEKEIGPSVWTQAVSESSYESREDEDATMTDAENDDFDGDARAEDKTAFGNRARFAPCAFDPPTSSSDDGTKPPCIVTNTGAFATAGARGNDKMEDRHKIFREFNGLPHCAVMAVFDGHRGFECAEFCSENLSDAILSEWGENGNDIPSTLKKVFQKLHAAFVKHWTEKERRDMHKSTADSKSKKKRYPGCTATVCFFWGDDVYVANAGDSRAVLGHHPTGNDEVDADEMTWSTALSEDHCASSNAKELERVKNSSANVKIQTLENGQIRVGDAGLAVTRALGDWDCTESGGVLSEPEVIKKTLTAETDAFITIACDGLWDVCTNTDMCSIIRDTVKEPSMCAKRLGCEALNRLSDDNISVLVGILGNEGTFAKVSWKSTYNDGFTGLK